MIGRAGQGLCIVCAGVALGLAIGGLPGRSGEDTNLSTLAPADATTTMAPAPTLPPTTLPATTLPATTLPVTTPPPPTASTAAASPAGGAHPPSAVHVLAINASSVPGVASRVGSTLRAQGWTVVPPSPRPYPMRLATSTVYYRSGFAPDAARLASTLGIDPSSVKPLAGPLPEPKATGADVVVLVGDGLATRKT